MPAPSAYSRRARAKISPVDGLFLGLDRRRLKKNGALVEVLGIHLSRGATWMQLSIADGPHEGVLVHVPRRATLDHVVAALNAWAATPEGQRSHVIHVMQLA